ncbi:MAG: hypothetical protein ACXWW6_00775 [Candidatus Limnocylindrales bacterium]
MRALVPLAAGLAALVTGTLFGSDPRLVDALVSPPAIVRAALVAATVLAGLRLLGRAIERIGEGAGQSGKGRGQADTDQARDLAGMIRAVRLVFLAVAAFAAAGGWLVGSSLPLILALVIAGVDTVETSFLLLVVTVRRGVPPAG